MGAEDLAERAFARGARLFDEGAFFDAHEAWEEQWLVETDATWRTLLQGLIQIAAAFHKLYVSGDRASALRLLAKGLAKLATCPDAIAGISLGRFREGIRACERSLTDGAPELVSIPRLGAGG